MLSSSCCRARSTACRCAMRWRCATGASKRQRFYDLARRYNVAIVFADDDDFPAIDEATADFTYARLMRTKEDVETGYAAADLDRWAQRARGWAERGDAFVYFISGAKLRAPAAAQALIERVG